MILTNMKKKTATTVAAAFVLSAVMPMAAFADVTYKTVRTATAQPGEAFKSTVRIELPQGSLSKDETEKFRIRVPKNTDNFDVKATVNDSYDNGIANIVEDCKEVDGEGSDIEKEFEVSPRLVNGAVPDTKGYITLDISGDIPSGFNGDYKVTFEAEGGSVFEDGALTIATVGSGTAKVEIDDVQSGSSDSDIELDTIRIREDRPGALDEASDSIKLKLPQGFKWVTDDLQISDSFGSGLQCGDATLADDDRTLKIPVETSSSEKAAYLRLTGLKVSVDESVAKAGDVTVALSGKSTLNPSSIVVAKYGEYNATVKAYGDTPTLLAGRVDEELGKLSIEEDMAGSLREKKSITLTLPENTRWELDADGAPSDPPAEDGSNSDKDSLAIGDWKFVDSEKRILKTTVETESTDDPAKLVLKNAKVSIAPNFTGDLTVEVSGNAGVTGKVVLGKVVAPVTLAAATVPEVKIGVDGQAAGDLVITENVKEAFMSKEEAAHNSDGDELDTTYKEVKFYLPAGAEFTATPKFEVTEGDLVIEPDSASTGYDSGEGQYYAKVKIKSTSTTPSKVKVSDIKVRVDRTVPEGDLIVKVKGNATALNEFVPNSVDRKPFSSSTIATAAIAKVVTPAPVDQIKVSVFKINEAKYTINGIEKTADQAPYIKDGRTYLPIRYVAESLGIDSNNILWDGAKQTVTLIKGDKVVQLTVGSNALVINGAAITMDVAPEITPAGRVALPVKFVAQAFGATADWDAATQSVTLK
ncbi:hypothetical protein GJ688_11525 [Heliobacillus mobilis]|uniref:Copper amine oxidase-like N-terminal domain-containing protein n=1 Tax=Heliobacterium mobile TaxID=28064 RepID=A0A6I3SMN4_HELMO|nr:copper amine oxidase N-terminal domain-containing protein [Heliobacterium mobile]MTV49607.1 hypothetical protein [Heliobacterium mobile]